jgi:hypothetical protein
MVICFFWLGFYVRGFPAATKLTIFICYLLILIGLGMFGEPSYTICETLLEFKALVNVIC